MDTQINVCWNPRGCTQIIFKSALGAVLESSINKKFNGNTINVSFIITSSHSLSHHWIAIIFFVVLLSRIHTVKAIDFYCE